MGCEQTREVAAEVALGLADGEQRAQALRHLAECAECRRLVEELSAVGDELLLLAPDVDPPAGFESRALARIAPAPRPRRRRRTIFGAVAAAAAAAAAAVVITLGATSDDRRLAQHFRATLAVAHGSAFEAAPLRGAGGMRAGAVYGYRGAPSWIFVAIYRPYRDHSYTAELITTAGRRVPLASLRLDPRTGSAGQSIAVDLDKVKAVRLVGSARGDVLEAALPNAR
jgi:hypothetical protein